MPRIAARLFPQDGGTARMLVASEVPFTVVGWFREYATEQGYAAHGMARQRVGATLEQSSSESIFVLSATLQ